MATFLSKQGQFKVKPLMSGRNISLNIVAIVYRKIQNCGIYMKTQLVTKEGHLDEDFPNSQPSIFHTFPLFPHSSP